MKRRTLLQLASAVMASWPFSRLRAFAQAPLFSERQREALAALAEAALPASIGANGRAAAMQQFIAWHVNYRAGADMGHNYGSATLRRPSPPPVAPQYTPQFTALDEAARAQGALSFASAPLAVRRTIAEAALNTPQPLNRLPSRPTGANLVADFMGLYFNSADAYDLAYRAAIGRDDCRGLDGSDQPPPPLTIGSRTTAGGR